MGWRHIEEQEKSKNQNPYGKPVSLHRAHLLNKNIYTPSILRKQGETENAKHLACLLQAVALRTEKIDIK
jgi:hypothetical protein